MSNTRLPGARAIASGLRAIVSPSSIAAISPDDLGLAPHAHFVTQGTPGITPTVAQFLNASNTEYLISGTPAGLHAFVVNGSQLGYLNEADGVAAKVWLTAANQVVIAYQGTTGGENLLLNPLLAVTQIAADIGVAAGTTTPGERDSLSFARTVLADAAKQGIDASNVFVTGHSLGGIEAEYVAQQTGLGGVAFESTGIPRSVGAGTGANFVNVVTYGDPVGNYASDIRGLQPFAPSYSAGGGSLPHYGHVVMIGNAGDQSLLAWNWWNLPGLAGLVLDFHLPGTQAHDLGVSLNPYSVVIDTLGNQSGPVFSAGNDTISQLLTASGATGHLLNGHGTVGT